MFKHDLGAGADLRILERRHAGELLEFVAANRAYLGEWLGWAKTMQTVEDAERWLARGTTRFTEDGLPWVGIWQDDQMAGGILFFPVEWPPRATEIGYWLGEQATGRGLMSRAVGAMLRYLFEDLALNRVALQADVNNTRSRAVAERLGFQFEGIRRQSWAYEGRLLDMAGYAMLAEEWRASRPL